MGTLRAAIVARYGAVTGGAPPLYFEEAPEAADPSAAAYVVYLLIPSPPELTTGDGTTEAWELSLSGFASTAAAADAIGAALAAAFNPARARTPLAWDDGAELTMVPLGGRTMREDRHGRQPDRGPGDVQVWHHLRRFRLVASGSLAATVAAIDTAAATFDTQGFDVGTFD